MRAAATHRQGERQCFLWEVLIRSQAVTFFSLCVLKTLVWACWQMPCKAHLSLVCRTMLLVIIGAIMGCSRMLNADVEAQDQGIQVQKQLALNSPFPESSCLPYLKFPQNLPMFRVRRGRREGRADTQAERRTKRGGGRGG